MKTLRRVCAATILSLTFAVSAFAGDVHCPGVVVSTSTDSTSVTTAVILAVVSATY